MATKLEVLRGGNRMLGLGEFGKLRKLQLFFRRKAYDATFRANDYTGRATAQLLNQHELTPGSCVDQRISMAKTLQLKLYLGTHSFQTTNGLGTDAEVQNVCRAQ